LPACATCKKYLVKYSWPTAEGTGEPLMWQSGPGEWKPVERRENQPPPCGLCPKKGPEHEHEFVLSLKNLQTLAFYQETKATFGRGLTEEEAQDSIVRSNFEILDRLFARLERERQAQAVSAALSRLMAR
ncbi:MAG: hypothetical protein KGL35_28410, partial [Bradyrhizobium sp.]|nr:hypothetical protein [Bradyrhizobium sp.]